jgi:hypothetical protein
MIAAGVGAILVGALAGGCGNNGGGTAPDTPSTSNTAGGGDQGKPAADVPGPAATSLVPDEKHRPHRKKEVL